MGKHPVLDQLHKAGFDKKQLEQSLARATVWSRDASHFQIHPGSTLRARNVEDISLILAAAHVTKTPVTFRSGGSSLSGQTLGTGLVVDTRTGFQSIVDIQEDCVTAQAGVTLARLNGHLLRIKRKVGPDPASLVSSTLGGAVSNNSSGMTCGTANNSYATIRSVSMVFADGQMFDSAGADANERLRLIKPELVALLEALRDRIRGNPLMVATITRLFTLKNTMGYSLNAFLDYHSPVDILVHLMVGSEGTLGFLGDITMNLVPVYAHTSTTLLLFESLDKANDSLVQIIGHAPAAIELMDRTSLAALDAEGLLPDELGSRVSNQSAAVLVQFESDNEQELEKSSTQFLRAFRKAVVFGGVTDPQLRARLWALRKNLYAIVAKARPAGTTALLEDVAVPPEKITHACKEISRMCERHGYATPVIFGHVRDGNIHFMISDDFSQPHRIAAFEGFTKDLVDLVLGLGGNLKAEHGTGRAMAPFVEAQFGPELTQIIREIKHGFDPSGILNPGVIIAASETGYLENLKTVVAVDPIIDSCVECGYCESSCPSQGLTLTPRERIVAYRELPGQTGKAKKELAKELHYQADQTCATDGMCAINCPVGINTGTFIKEIRAQEQTRLSQTLGVAMQAHWGRIAAVAGLGLRVANRVPTLARQASKALAAIAPQGTTPTWDTHVVGAGFRRKKLESASQAPFTYLPSCMNEIFGDSAIPEILRIAAEHGVAVSVPENLTEFCCGTPFSSKGLTRAYAKQVAKNAHMSLSLEGTQLVIDGSSCHQTLSAQVERPVLELSEFVAAELLDVPVKKRHDVIILHPTCSGVATGSNHAMETIARHIAKEVVIPTDWKCCGFAGDRGLLLPELTSNATVQEAREVGNRQGLLVSNNQPCQIGMSGATGRPYVSILEAWLQSVR